MNGGGDGAGRVGFEGPVWLLREKKSTFYAAQWRQEPAVLRSVTLPPWPRTQVLLELEQREFLVLRAAPGDASARSGDAKESKCLLQLDVRSMEDVRRAQLYQTAARTQTLELFLDVDFTRERMLRFIGDPDADASAAHASGETSSQPSATQLIDSSFASLERAQRAREAGVDLAEALRLFRAAAHGFESAERLVPDDRTRRLLQERCQDLKRSIRSLEAKVSRANECGGAPAAPVGSTSGRSFPEPPTCTAAAQEPATTDKAVDVRSRLEELRRFAADQEVGRAQREHGTAPSDLAVRLAALRNERPGPAPPMSDLSERLRRLRGGSPSVPAVAVAGDEDVPLGRKSAVDRVIEQVQDELALGIEDEEEEEEEEVEEESSGSESFSSSGSESSSTSDDKRSVGKSTQR